MAYVHIDDDIMPYLEILIDCVKLRSEDIEKQIKRITDDSELMSQCLEDEFLAFKLHSKKIRDEYKKAVDEQLSKNEQVWAECDELLVSTRPKVEAIKKDISSLTEMIEEVGKALDGVSLYKAEKLLDLIHKFNNMPAVEKQLFSKLLKVSQQ